MTTITEYAGRVPADQSIVSSTTLVNVTDFVQAVAANSIWGFQAIIQFNLAGVLSGFKFGLSTPTSPTNGFYTIEVLNGTGLSIVALGLSATVSGALATTGLHVCRVSGMIENGSTAGNIAVQIAQNVSDGSAITVKRGSWMRAWNLG